MSGKGGNGSVSFRREKSVPFGGPDGGDGGRGGDIIIKAVEAVTTLRAFKFKHIFQAQNGGAGGGNKRHGKAGDSITIEVPLGTVVWQIVPDGGNILLVDLEKNGQEILVAKGGRGGLGNPHFATSINQAPRLAQHGEPGLEKNLMLELRLIADVGIVGHPNAGKSTLLSWASAANPEIAPYPFTTKEPILGVVEMEEGRFVLAEIPGLIEGAHTGKGLGHEFLRHVTRTRVVIHLIDGSSADPVEDMRKVNNELSLFNEALGRKPQIVAVNKIDMPEVRERMPEIRKQFKAAKVDVKFISASQGEGVPQLMAAAYRLLHAAPPVEFTDEIEEAPVKVFRPLPVDTSVIIRKEGDYFIVDAPQMERLIPRGANYEQALIYQLQQEIIRLSGRRAMKRSGIKSGDMVKCCGLEWEWTE